MKSFVLNGVRFIRSAKERYPNLNSYDLCIEFKPNQFCFGKFSCCDDYSEIYAIRFFFLNKKITDTIFMFKNLNIVNRVSAHSTMEFLSSDYSLFKKLKLLE